MTNGAATIYKFNEWKALTDFLAEIKSTCEVRITQGQEGWTVSVDQPAIKKNVKPKVTIGVSLYDLYW
jgi:hypothetical protein